MSIAFIVDQLVLHRGNTHAIMHVYNVILQLLVEQLCGAVVPQEKQNIIWKQQFTTFEAFVLQYSQEKSCVAVSF